MISMFFKHFSLTYQIIVYDKARLVQVVGHIWNMNNMMNIHWIYIWEFPTLSHGNSYVFYEVANSYEFVRPHSYDLSKPQWRVGLGAGLGVGHSYKFIRIGNS